MRKQPTTRCINEYAWKTTCGCEVDCAHYRCEKCGTTWKSKPDSPACPNCRSPYVAWANYESWSKAHGHA
jgi:hypothetical protein